ncbi:hypothetical protein Tsubulata_047592 [Turnera subulata]|uniref:Uncharacterized protein n=1 Tax=Turnera subulata TaxID=218843 RepID=A0A9Q0FK80_9ROSI|nr:hypothetical protein Tsubulata_047592 [Turnera subulata]
MSYGLTESGRVNGPSAPVLDRKPARATQNPIPLLDFCFQSPFVSVSFESAVMDSTDDNNMKRKHAGQEEEDTDVDADEDTS